MKHSINIRSDENKPKVGSYQAVRDQINKAKIEKANKKSITSSTDPSKVVTTKHLNDQ